MTPPRQEVETPSDRPNRVKRLGTSLLIFSLCCFAFVAVLVFMITHHQLDSFQAPDWVYGCIFLGPLCAGVAALWVVRRLARRGRVF